MDWNQVESCLKEEGIAQIGFADLSGIVPRRYAHLPYGISLVWKLCDGVLDEVEKGAGPTFTYFQHYRAVNAELDRLTLRLAAQIEREGYRALPIGASQSVHDAGEYSGAFQHKTVAVHSGLGWIGKSALFISKQFGPRVRLVTVLTDMPLPVPKDLDMTSRCGDCDRCVKACPANAVIGAEYRPGASRDTIFLPQACSEYMKNTYMNIGRGAVCGICAAVCPWGKKKGEEIK